MHWLPLISRREEEQSTQRVPEQVKQLTTLQLWHAKLKEKGAAGGQLE